MTPRVFCASGTAEGLKGGFHAAATLILGAMATYNIAAWCFRRDPHLGVNAVLYTLGAGWEVKQTLSHLKKP